MIKQYETVFIATPVLSEAQMKEAVAKYTKLITDEDWGLKQLAYPIQHKTSGFYYLIEFKAEPEFVATLETQYHRDERILRYLTVALDKHAVAYAEHRRQTRAAKAAAPKPAAEPVEAAPAVAEPAAESENTENAEA